MKKEKQKRNSHAYFEGNKKDFVNDSSNETKKLQLNSKVFIRNYIYNLK